jgi:hypothetical protein
MDESYSLSLSLSLPSSWLTGSLLNILRAAHEGKNTVYKEELESWMYFQRDLACTPIRCSLQCGLRKFADDCKGGECVYLLRTVCTNRSITACVCSYPGLPRASQYLSHLWSLLWGAGNRNYNTGSKKFRRWAKTLRLTTLRCRIWWFYLCHAWWKIW